MRYPAKIALSCSILLLLALQLAAQNQDYVIITRGDKLPCKISFPMFNIDGQYKTDAMDEPEKLDPYQLNEYYVARDKETYRAVYEPVSKTLKFMLVIESGKINLYQYTMRGEYKSNGYTTVGTGRYIEKKPDIFITLKPRPFYYDKTESNWTDEFVELIKDNKSVYDKYVADRKFSFKEIIKITHLYNTLALPAGNEVK